MKVKDILSVKIQFCENIGGIPHYDIIIDAAPLQVMQTLTEKIKDLEL